MQDMEAARHTTILALDASTVAIGWAVMDYETVTAWGVKKLDGEFHDRLFTAHYWLHNKIDEYGVGVVALEQPVLHRNPRKCNVETVLHLAYVDGALMAAASSLVSNVVEIRPGERLAALGLPINLPRARAKELVRQRVNAIFNLELDAKQHDAADAIAVGLAAIRRMLQKL